MTCAHEGTFLACLSGEIFFGQSKSSEVDGGSSQIGQSNEFIIGMTCTSGRLHCIYENRLCRRKSLRKGKRKKKKREKQKRKGFVEHKNTSFIA